MSIYGMENELCAAEQKAKQTRKGTYRAVLEDRVAEVAYQSIGGSPWSYEFNFSLDRLNTVIGHMIAADPVLNEVFGKSAKPKHLEGTKLESGPVVWPEGYVSDEIPF